MFWTKKKRDFTDMEQELCDASSHVEFSDVRYRGSVYGIKSLKIDEVKKPDKPDWYNRKWEVCLSGNSTWKYAIKCDGLLIPEFDLAYARDTTATFYSEEHARYVMYALIHDDIARVEHRNRKGETVETWP